MIKIKKYTVICNPQPWRSDGEYSIEEFFVPKPYNIAFNYASPVMAIQKPILNIFSTTKPRNAKNMIEIEVDEKSIIKLKKIFDLDKQLQQEKADFMKNDTKIFDKFKIKNDSNDDFNDEDENEDEDIIVRKY